MKATRPEGGTIVAEVGTHLIYEDEEKTDSRVHIYFFEGSSPFFTAREEKYMLSIMNW